MVALRWIASLALAGSLASCSPQICETTNEAASPIVHRSADRAQEFVSGLIANATEAEQQHQAQRPRFLSCPRDESLIVDLGYARYRGYHDPSTGLNYWKGIRYAAAPTGSLRWQPPHPLPLQTDAPITDATTFGPVCPQSLPAVPNAPFLPGNEDCLFLNVYAPANATNLPVLVYIHPGGYGLGDGTQDMTDIINSNDKGFVAVTVQYRLGAFGFLSSKEVKQKGVVNAGILDQALALAWVKLFICQFGGNPSRVTISGESAGGGSVMYHGLAVNGLLGSLLFNQGIAASPYLPFQYNFDDAFPTSKYNAFAQVAGCSGSSDVFACLVSKDTDTLQQASFNVTQQSTYGYWGFWPVTDNAYIMNLPSQQLAAKKLNGKKLLVGHNANEGGLFVPPVLTTQDDLIVWLQSQFPNLSHDQIHTILAANPNSELTNPAGPRFETDGLNTNGANAVTVSQDANGQQQRGNNIYAESTFACPAYWMAEAYSGKGTSSWLYQFSVPFAFHGADIAAYFGPQTPNLSDDFVLAFRRMWGNFVMTGNPSISNVIANGAGSADPEAPHPASNWPVWSKQTPNLMNLNITGGVPYDFATQWGTVVTQFTEPGLKNAITLASSDTWEGGRGARCDVYRSLAQSIPL
ncbi:Carboxylic ester hydrolase [Madurella fahalii]|uniref:Carboxylic ester hydrolase n=1 Tax=Madurella fahalii TaxID=1157608 RepID=A0ABQ0GQ38_9PEZI